MHAYLYDADPKTLGANPKILVAIGGFTKVYLRYLQIMHLNNGLSNHRLLYGISATLVIKKGHVIKELIFSSTASGITFTPPELMI